MGTVMSYALGLSESRPAPAGIVALSGFIPTVEGFEPHFEDRESLPVVIRHGSEDPVISVEFARDARRRLEGAGLAVEYHEHGGGHHIDPHTVPPMTSWVGERVAQFGI